MNLDNLLNKQLEFTVRRKQKPISKPNNKEKGIIANAKKAVRLITTGDYNSKNPRHRQCLCYARRLNWVDRNSLKIIKEE